LAKVIFDGKDEKFNPNDYRSSRFKNEADKMKHDNTVNVDVLANEDWTPDDLIDESLMIFYAMLILGKIFHLVLQMQIT